MADDVNQQLEATAKQAVADIMGGTDLDRQLNKRAAELLMQELAPKNPDRDENRRLGNMSHNEFQQELRKYGIW